MFFFVILTFVALVLILKRQILPMKYCFKNMILLSGLTFQQLDFFKLQFNQNLFQRNLNHLSNTKLRNHIEHKLNCWQCSKFSKAWPLIKQQFATLEKLETHDWLLCTPLEARRVEALPTGNAVGALVFLQKFSVFCIPSKKMSSVTSCLCANCSI